MNILQVSTFDIAGGAEKIALNLHQQYRKRGHHAWLAVGQQRSDGDGILPIPHAPEQSLWEAFWTGCGQACAPFIGRVKGAGWCQRTCHQLADLDHLLGHEDFRFPATSHLLDLSPKRPEVLHCHNLHGDYFDLRALAPLSRQVPVILTLHDAWLLSGHCSHSFECERWKSGCGHCPDLTIRPEIARDATAYNWRRKRSIYARSCLYVATPSSWLMRKVEQSMLDSAIIERRIIPNGIDLSIFHPPENQRHLRATLNIPLDVNVLLFTAYSIRENPWKDYAMMRTAIQMLAQQNHDQYILFIALGEELPSEHIGRSEVRFIAYQDNPNIVAQYYQAADIYIHAAKVEVWGLTITEAMACGLPVVATTVGGILEQLTDGRTGYLVPPGDASAMAGMIQKLLNDASLRKSIGRQSADYARQRLGIDRMANEYITWYQEILQHAPPSKGTKGHVVNAAFSMVKEICEAHLLCPWR